MLTPSDKQWSVRMADSVIARNPEPWMIDFRKKPKWEYTQGLVLKAIWGVWETTGDSVYFKYVKAYYDQFVDDNGDIMLYKMEDYNIDRINPGKPLFPLYAQTGEGKYRKAIFKLREQMMLHPRTSEGGFWHKKRYPHQMWVDGLYMASPFLAEFAGTFNEPGLYDEVCHQLILMEKYARDASTGLLYHGWDESRQQRWSDPETGLSSHFWGRGIGWYAMALVDVLEFLPLDHEKRSDLLAILQRLAVAIEKYQDADAGLWYQVVDQATRKGNYLESSASSMFAYALIKAVRNNYVDQRYARVAKKAYAGILAQFIEIDKDGLVNIHNACAVAGLGGDPYRDGSYEYYINEEIRSNDPKAVGPFILASLQFEAMTRDEKE
ncbi:MAG: glycoside hydrolase family 88 protein [candidate division KSB1 bacterium]|nr:glycoside hydrolase family 88 protein [candidate division KSB1 bacterium]